MLEYERQNGMPLETLKPFLLLMPTNKCCMDIVLFQPLAVHPDTYTSHGHKVNHFNWNFLSSWSLLASLESVGLVLQDGPCSSNSTVAPLLFLCSQSVSANSAYNFMLKKVYLVLFGLEYYQTSVVSLEALSRFSKRNEFISVRSRKQLT